MAHDMIDPAASVAGVVLADAVPGVDERRLPPVAVPAEVADGGFIRFGAGLGLPAKRG